MAGRSTVDCTSAAWGSARIVTRRGGVPDAAACPLRLDPEALGKRGLSEPLFVLGSVKAEEHILAGDQNRSPNQSGLFEHQINELVVRQVTPALPVRPGARTSPGKHLVHRRQCGDAHYLSTSQTRFEEVTLISVSDSLQEDTSRRSAGLSLRVVEKGELFWHGNTCGN